MFTNTCCEHTKEESALTCRQIAHNDFPVPRIPQPTTTASLPPSASEPRFLAPLPPSSDVVEPPSSTADSETGAIGGSHTNSAASSQENNKENDAPPEQEPQTDEPTSDPATETSQPAVVAELEPGALPPQITAMLDEITGVLTETFSTYPPHTIQRLAELVLEPRRHYRSLPAYLHAVDRVVHVTSGNNIYPLAPAVPDMSHMNINGLVDGHDSNGAGEGSSTSGQAIWASSNNGAPIDSDEALGGALLTPIPWLTRRPPTADGGSESGESSTLGSEGGPSPLGPAAAAGTGQQRQSRSRQFEMQVRTESTETIDGPNGMGSIETVSVVNGISSLSPAQQQRVITQGELIRQEQRAGVVPVTQLTRAGPVVAASSSGAGSSATTSAEAGSDTTMDDSDPAAAGEGEGDGEAAKDDSSEKLDEDMSEEEAPHARGPDIIGAADMGPQTSSSSTFSISSGANAEVHSIDVEAAVGRKHEDQVQHSEGESDDGVVLTPASSEPEADASGKADVKDGDLIKPADEASEQKEPSAGTDAEHSPATLTATSSPAPGKREAEDDIAETESVSSKRLKGSPGPEDGDAMAVEEDAPAETDAETKVDASGEAMADAQPELTGSEGKPSDSASKKDGDSDVAVSDAASEIVGTEAKDPADDAGVEDEDKTGEAKPADEAAE